MSELSAFDVGQTVELGDGQVGVVQFVGNTHFAPGDWIGVVFDEPIGKNDGSVQGQRYFDCAAGHGMFIRPAVATPVDRPDLKPAAHPTSMANGKPSKTRQSTVGAGVLKKSGTDALTSKRQSLNASSPTPTSRVSRLTAPSKSPTKQLGSNASSVSSTPRTSTPTNTARKSITTTSSRNRTSMGPPPPPTSSAVRRTTRPSINSSTNGSINRHSQESAASGKPNSRLSTSIAKNQNTRSASGDSGMSEQSRSESPFKINSSDFATATAPEAGREGKEISDTRSTSAKTDSPEDSRPPSVPANARPLVVPMDRNTTGSGILKKENDDLATKLRLMEKRRAEDRERLKTLEKVQVDRDRFEGIIQKLQAKYQPQQQELVDLKRQMKDTETKLEALEAQNAESDTLNEMATLDREMAEEMAESAKSELQALRQRHEELELEAEILRTENQEFSKEISPEERGSQGWLQLERQNERYREALMRLRDVTQQQEADLKEQIGDLEEELTDYAKLQEEAASTKQKLSQTDAHLEDLRQQLDNALGAEDMIEELAQKNLLLNEQMDDLRTTIEELESLRELNDELEINHVETEKQLQDEIDYQENLLAEEARKVASQDGNIQDLEYTISRFRELVTTMQSDFEDMKAAQQITETQANELSTRSRAMENLNLKLQNSAAKAQVKAIDLELGRMQSRESAEHLAIVKMFLPESFKSEGDSIQALLRFRRMEFKSSLLHGFLRERINDSTITKHEEAFGLCNVMDKLIWISSSCRRFVNNLRTCGLDTFQGLGAASFDLDPAERAIDKYINLFKQDELKVPACEDELSRYIALMTHLAEVHISDNLEHYADLVLHHAIVVQSKLENAALVLLHVKSFSENRFDESGSAESAEDEFNAAISRLDSAISQTRSSKVVSSKIIHQIEDLQSRNLTLEQSTLPTIEQSTKAALDLTKLCVDLGMELLETQGEESGASVVSVQSLLSLLQTGKASVLSIHSKAQAASSSAHSFYTLTTSLSQAVEFSPSSNTAPWKVLAQNMHAATSDLNARQAEIGQLRSQILEKNTALATREKDTEEISVKLQVLERNAGEFQAQREKLKQAENRLEVAKGKEKDLIGKLAHLKNEYQLIEAEREKLKQSLRNTPQTTDKGPSTTIKRDVNVTSESSLRRISILEAEIKTLQSTIRHYYAAAHARSMTEQLDFLSTPLTSTTTTKSPAKPRPAQTEARDVLKEMLGLISQDESQVITLKPRKRSDRLQWRPARETTIWQVQKQKEEWEEWREWRNDVAKREVRSRNMERKINAAAATAGATATDEQEGRRMSRRTPLAKLSMHQLPSKTPPEMGGGEFVKIADPEDGEVR